MLASSSTHFITWHRPDITGETWEFFHHPAKQDFYRRHRITWEQILEADNRGRLEPYPRSDHLGDLPVSLSYHRYEDYEKYVAQAKRGYRLSYSKMEKALQRSGSLSLPSPIILSCGNEALLYSGYRRLCLAWNYGAVPYVWSVQIT